MTSLNIYISEKFKESRYDIYNLIAKINEKYKKILILIKNEKIDILDKELWIFSQKHFISHLKFEEIVDDFELEHTKCIIHNNIEISNKIKPQIVIFIEEEENIIDLIRMQNLENVQLVLIFKLFLGENEAEEVKKETSFQDIKIYRQNNLKWEEFNI